MSFNRDSLVALCLILASGGLMLASFEIREPDYGVLSPAAWPRIIIIIIGGLSVIYLIQSFSTPQKDISPVPKKTLKGFVLYWRNVIAVFSIFALYLLALPYLGMLVGNILFSFILLTVLGGWNAILTHLECNFNTSGNRLRCVWRHVVSLYTCAGSVFATRIFDRILNLKWIFFSKHC